MPGGRRKLSAHKFLGKLITSIPSRLWFVSTLIICTVVLHTLFQDQTGKLVGYSAIPLGLWLVAVLFLGLFNRTRLIAHWRWAASSLLLVLAISGILGIFYAPLTSFSGETYGGDLGIVISRLPSEWRRFDTSFLDYATAWARVFILLFLAFTLYSPSKSKRTVSWLGKSLLIIYMAIATLAQRVYKRFTNWRIERSQIKALRASDIADYEVDQRAQAKVQTEKLQDEQEIVQDLPNSINPAITEDIDPENQSHLELEKSFEKVPEDESTPGKAAYPSPTEVEVAAAASVPSPDYSSAYRFFWQLPNLEILSVAEPGGITQEEINTTSLRVEESLQQFDIDVSVDQVRQGPTVTMYGLSPGWKGRSEATTGQRVRVDTILNREKDIALALASPNLRFEAPVPGESVVGIEVPNTNPTQVTLRSVMDSSEWGRFTEATALPVPLGLGSGGGPVMADLSRMPHILIAGSTGSGKSVCMNTIITGLIMTRTPLELRLVMIDPKRVELTPYQGIPHLYTPVVVETDRAVIVLKSLVDEMMGRFRQLEQAGVKNISAYNEKIKEKMPYLVILVDELADLMLTAAGEVERLLVRLAQLGRATGVHLVLATQRPSVDVVTGLIKANFPSRISFAVSSQIDSRTILDSVGAEKLLGRGDMLYMPIDKPKPFRVQGALLSDVEIEATVAAWQNMKAPDLPHLHITHNETDGENGTTHNAGSDSLFDQAANLARSQKTLSVSLLQRRLRIGYPRAARLMDELEDNGIVGAGEPGKPRPVM